MARTKKIWTKIKALALACKANS